jgi:hypothetical protein
MALFRKRVPVTDLSSRILDLAAERENRLIADLRSDPKPLSPAAAQRQAKPTLAHQILELRQRISAELARSSKDYEILSQLDEHDLRECARCTKELERRLAADPRYLVLQKLDETYALAKRNEALD